MALTNTDSGTGPKPTFGAKLPPTAGLGGQLTGVQVGGKTTTLPRVPAGPATDTGASGGGGAGGGGGGGGNAPDQPQSNWADVFWGGLGLPPDVVSQINKIFQQYTDVTQAQMIAQNYLRGTSWFATTFPGFDYGVRNGLFTDETGYRRYVDELNVATNQYLGRHVGGDEVKAALTEGIDTTVFGKRLEGQAYINANAPELQFEAGAFGGGQFTKDQLTTLGRQQAGLTSQAGFNLDVMVKQAAQRMQKVFQGTLGTPSLTLGAGGLQSPGLAGQRANAKPDVAA